MSILELMKPQRLKKPSDYPQYTFRLTTQDEKNRLDERVEEVLALFNASVPEGFRKHRKNEIIIEALEKGLTQMKRSKTR